MSSRMRCPNARMDFQSFGSSVSSTGFFAITSVCSFMILIFWLLLMIRLTMNNAIASIDLLQKNYSHHLMGKGHFRKGEKNVRSLHGFRREAEGAANQEGHLRFPF